MCLVTEAVLQFANSDSTTRGAVFTKPEVVEFILDLVGYTTDKALYQHRILEPSFGAGDFLIPIIFRLVTSLKKHQKTPDYLLKSVRAVELHKDTYERTRQEVHTVLLEAGFLSDDVKIILDAWLINGDYLLTSLPDDFTHVVGNPPYVRQEAIPDDLLNAYRERYETIYDRADLYVPFIEKSLQSLKPKGSLGFICADRWMKNKYGKNLRNFVSKNFHLSIYVNMVDTDAFHHEVSTYPAITIINREQGSRTKISHKPRIDRNSLSDLSNALIGSSTSHSQVCEIENVASGSEPWILENFKELELVRKLEARFSTLEEAGCKVGIGVATGADKAFIGAYANLDVEEDRKLKLAMNSDIKKGVVKWGGLGVINPFSDSGKLVDLAFYPKLKKFLETRKDQIAGRHVAIKNPKNWYRTIDRIYPELATKPKLLIPDIKGHALIVHEDGMLYPHHNLYFITSEGWDLHALQKVLQSGIAHLFVSLYSTKIRGGYLRFQAQYLRKIRIPQWADIPQNLQTQLSCASCEEINQLVAELYDLTSAELNLLNNNSKEVHLNAA